MGQNRARPILSILVDDTVLFYEMFAHDNGIDGHIAIRFRKIQKNVVIREQRFVGPNGRAPLEVALENEKRFQYINYFDRMGTLVNITN
jgi:hypothetical protein